jgi:hypothetical protein
MAAEIIPNLNGVASPVVEMGFPMAFPYRKEGMIFSTAGGSSGLNVEVGARCQNTSSSPFGSVLPGGAVADLCPTMPQGTHGRQGLIQPERFKRKAQGRR